MLDIDTSLILSLRSTQSKRSPSNNVYNMKISKSYNTDSKDAIKQPGGMISSCTTEATMF